MPLTNRLHEWRDPDIWDKGEDITEEKVLRQFLYSAIVDFLDEKWVALVESADGDKQDEIALSFVDEYSAP